MDDWMLYRDESGGTVEAPSGRRSLLVTGAGGRIGGEIISLLAEHFDLRLMMGDAGEESVPDLREHGEVVVARLEDPASLKPVFAGMDTVLHMAAVPHASATWEEVLRDNIIGLRNAMEAAREAGCRRVVFTSSIHAVWGRASEAIARADGPVRPTSLYGVSKCFGEAYGRYLAETGVMDVICLRLGAFMPATRVKKRWSPGHCAMWLSPRDFAQAVILSVKDTRLCFGIFNVVSDNREKRLDIEETRRVLGYAPVDDAFAIADGLSE